MKPLRIKSLLLALCLLCLMTLPALAATEDDARALMTQCGIGEPVTEQDNKMGITLKDVRFDEDGDVYIQWAFANEIMLNNMTYAYTQIRFFDPAKLTAPYAAFTINNDNTLNLHFKKDDSINLLDYVHLNQKEFNPESGVIFMYFNGSGQNAPEEFLTRPLVFTIYVDNGGCRAVETTPRYAPEEMIAAFAAK